MSYAGMDVTMINGDQTMNHDQIEINNIQVNEGHKTDKQFKQDGSQPDHPKLRPIFEEYETNYEDYPLENLEVKANSKRRRGKRYTRCQRAHRRAEATQRTAASPLRRVQSAEHLP